MDNHWISVSERTPDLIFNGCSNRVLVITESGHYEVGYYANGVWERDVHFSNFSKSGYTITHWQNLPQPPEIAHSQAEKDSWDSVN